MTKGTKRVDVLYGKFTQLWAKYTAMIACKDSTNLGRVPRKPRAMRFKEWLTRSLFKRGFPFIPFLL